MSKAKPLFHLQICKGCALCAEVCPKGLIDFAKKTNDMGYYPALLVNEERCNGCGLCCIMCPDMAITIAEEGSHEDIIDERQ